MKTQNPKRRMQSFTVFTILLTVVSDAQSTAGCSSSSGSVAVPITDGKNERCFSVITPPMAKKPMPVLFWFHGAGGNAEHCGTGGPDGPGLSLADLAKTHGFALVCGNAVAGQWQIPEVFNDDTGLRCDSNSTVEMTYIDNIIRALATKSPGTYDTSRLFTSGCSMGSAFSLYVAPCLEVARGAGAITAFATHSTGYKIKGDGNRLPDDNYLPKPNGGWGECAGGCKYWPTVIVRNSSRGSRTRSSFSKLKACIFDNKQDPSAADPFFYRTSTQLERVWQAAGGRAEAHYGTGGHCEIHSFEAVVNCLDDGTRRLLPGGDAPTPSPTPSPPPDPHACPGAGPDAACLAAVEKICPAPLRGRGLQCTKCLNLSVSQEMGACAQEMAYGLLQNCYCWHNATATASTKTTRMSQYSDAWATWAQQQAVASYYR